MSKLAKWILLLGCALLIAYGAAVGGCKKQAADKEITTEADADARAKAMILKGAPPEVAK